MDSIIDERVTEIVNLAHLREPQPEIVVLGMSVRATIAGKPTHGIGAHHNGGVAQGRGELQPIAADVRADRVSPRANLAAFRIDVPDLSAKRYQNGAGLEGGKLPLQPLGMGYIVRVHSRNQRRRGADETGIQRIYKASSRVGARLYALIAQRVPINDAPRRIRRSIVDDDELPIAKCLRPDAGDCRFEIVPAISDGQEHAYR